MNEVRLVLRLPPGWTRHAVEGPTGGDMLVPCLPEDTVVPCSASRVLVSPLLPLPRSLPDLLEQALRSEPDFVAHLRSEVRLVRLGAWEVVQQSARGHSRSEKIEMDRVYVGLDGGFGAWLLVLIVFGDAQPGLLLRRQHELGVLIASATMQRPQKGSDKRGTGRTPERASAGVPVQKATSELFLSQVLYRHLLD